MKKLSFVEKNDALVRLKNKEHFDKDCELLRKLNPTSRLHNEIANASEFSISSLSGRILMELLDLAPTEEIESNRSVADVKDKHTPDQTKETKEEDKPTENASSDDKPAEEVPGEEKPAEEASGEENPAEETSGEEKPAEEASGEEKPAEEAPGEEKPAEEASGEEKPAEEAPGEEQPKASGKGSAKSDKKKATKSKKIIQE